MSSKTKCILQYSSPCTGSLRVRWATWERTECVQRQSSLQPVATQVLASFICEDTFLSHYSVKRGPANSLYLYGPIIKLDSVPGHVYKKKNIQEQKMLITDILLILFASPGLLFWKLTNANNMDHHYYKYSWENFILVGQLNHSVRAVMMNHNMKHRV